MTLLATRSAWVMEPAEARTGQPARARTPRRQPTPSFTTVLRRREDFLRLRYEFYNLRLDTSGQHPQLVRKNPDAAAHIVVVFPAQALAEEAFYERDPDTEEEGEPAPDEDPGPPPVGARLGGESRLAYLVPASVTAVPYSVEALLGWNIWALQVPPAALPPGAGGRRSGFVAPPLRAPTALETAIELPWWLLLAPHDQAAWAHATQPVTRNGRTELWHTRLGVADGLGGVDGADEDLRTVRAVWTRDPHFAAYLANPDHNPPYGSEDFPQHAGEGSPFRMTLAPEDRYDIVTSTADFQGHVSESGYRPDAVDVDRLMLTALGGSLDATGVWDASKSGTSLQSWRHQATGGRDHYVRIVRKGYLFPFGHGASLVKVTERKFHTDPGGRVGSGRRVAYLFQRYFVVVRQQTVDYGGAFDPTDNRTLPFTRVRFTTLITPNIDEPDGDDEGQPGLGHRLAFVPRVGGAPVLFQFVGTDHAGRPVDGNTAVVFVDADIAFDSTDMQTLIDWYHDDVDATAAERAAALHGAAVAVAPPEQAGDTDLEIHRLTWGAGSPAIGDDPTTAVPPTPQQLEDADHPAFLPIMAEARIRLATAEIAAGGALGGPPPVVAYNDTYLEKGFAGTAGQIFVELRGGAADLDFGGQQAGDRAGGLVTPSFGITALSRKVGTVGGPPEDFQDGTFDPVEIFGLDANLLGDISLADVLGEVLNFDLTDEETSQKILQLTTRDEPEQVVTELRWTPQLEDFTPVGTDPLFIASLDSDDVTKDASLVITATIVTPKSAPDDASFSVLGDLRNFQVALLPGAPMITVAFNRLRFAAAAGQKAEVDPEIDEVVFDGVLEFVNELKDYLSFSAGGFAIELKPTHLSAGFQIPLPAITVGVFSLQNLSFAAGTTIPFTGQPVRFRFGFCTIDDPFLLTVMIFGGGGFFQLDVGADGVEAFQAAFEFGAAAALDFGVASGSVSLTAGIYFAVGVENPPDNPDGKPELTGFLKLKGQVEVLGLITLTLLMKASITYYPDTKKGIAKAIVIVEIDLTLWSGSVEVEYEKQWGGSDDPTFGDTLTAGDWAAYAAAFAPIGA